MPCFVFNAGACSSQEDWLHKAAPIVMERIERYAASEIRFNLMAVIQDRQAMYEGELAQQLALRDRIQASTRIHAPLRNFSPGVDWMFLQLGRFTDRKAIFGASCYHQARLGAGGNDVAEAGEDEITGDADTLTARAADAQDAIDRCAPLLT